MYSIQIPGSDTPTNQRHVNRVLACRTTSKELQLRLSINSDSSAPEMTDGNDSDTSLEDDPIHDEAAERLWNKWFSTSPESHSGPFYQTQQATQSSYQVPAGSLCPSNRNYAPTNLSNLSLSSKQEPEPCLLDGIRSQRGRSQSNLVLPSHNYTPYRTFSPEAPPVPPKPKNYLPNTPNLSHNSWPSRSSSRPHRPRPPLSRLRANTAPGASAQYATTNQPSNLSYCTTLSPDLPCTPNSHSFSANGSLYTRSVPSSPFRPPPQLMYLMEKSVFEDDEEDESARLKIIRSLENKMRIRSGSGSGNRIGGSDSQKGRDGEGEEKEGGSLRIKRTVNRLKGVFGMRKSIG
ncbi:hypothetical protein HYFRA_00007229 [Hymenoscyphus fraxineus]|uniref:Uncharacterized protein n=1 Tax=Hymenoscyphus fraxineus TaxID=746836 RepID=A0A9N9KZ30_9HELO|nr:hypothetical protein HYFRA_00007229 [Hymenoscyphus fraxineus]